MEAFVSFKIVSSDKILIMSRINKIISRLDTRACISHATLLRNHNNRELHRIEQNWANVLKWEAGGGSEPSHRGNVDITIKV